MIGLEGLYTPTPRKSGTLLNGWGPCAGDWLATGGGVLDGGGGEVTSVRHIGSSSAVAERGLMTMGAKLVEEDIGVGVEKRLIS